MAVAYERNGDAVIWNQGVVRFTARNIRRERGQAHARITVTEGVRLLDEDDLAIEKREERTRLANAAHGGLNGTAQLYPKDRAYADLTLFCRDLWAFWMQAAGAVRTKGDLEPTEPDFLLDDYVLRDAGTILFAPPGAGKSWTGLLWAVSIDAGLCDHWIVQQVPVLYINMERSQASFGRRLGQVNEALGLPRDRALLMMHERGKSLVDIIDAVQTTIKREGVGLAFLDSLSRAGTGSMVKDDNANKSMDLANGFGCGWVALGHTNRAEDAHTFGSQMFDAAADLCVQLLPDEPKEMDALTATAPLLGIGLKVWKANDTAKPPLRIWTYGFDRRFGLTGVRKAKSGEWPGIEDDGQRAQSPQQQIAQLLAHGEMYVAEIAEAIGKEATNVSTYLKDMEKQGKAVRTRQDGRKQYWGRPSWRSD